MPASGADEALAALLDCWVELVTTGVLDCVFPVAELVWEPPFLESPPQADNTSARLNTASKWILIVLSLIVIVRPRFYGQTTSPDMPAMASGIDTMIESIANARFL